MERTIPKHAAAIVLHFEDIGEDDPVLDVEFIQAESGAYAQAVNEQVETFTQLLENLMFGSPYIEEGE